jgi:hypothetical protein
MGVRGLPTDARARSRRAADNPAAGSITHTTEQRCLGMTLTRDLALTSCQRGRQARTRDTSQNLNPKVMGKNCASAFSLPPADVGTSGPQT